MGETADVVVIGGGAMGTSIAWHLTELGVTDVVLVERETLASGSTSKSAGGFRAQFADELNVRIALRSIAELETFGERFGVDIALAQHGYLFLLDDDGDLERFRAALALQQRLGVPSRELTVDEALGLVPQVSAEGLVGATFCPVDGTCSPESVTQGYAQAAAARGVRVRQGVEATAIDVRNGRVAAVRTTAGAVATGTVVCAAGAWSAGVARTAGVELPVSGEPRHVWFTPEDGGLPRELPLTIDFGSGLYLHREGAGIVFGGRAATLEELAPQAARRVPVLAELPIRSSWWGYYEVSPDWNAIVGEVEHVSRFLYATGFSGHGFQQAPAVGEHLAQLVAGVETTLDLSPFSVDRFARGDARSEQLVV